MKKILFTEQKRYRFLSIFLDRPLSPYGACRASTIYIVLARSLLAILLARRRNGSMQLRLNEGSCSMEPAIHIYGGMRKRERRRSRCRYSDSVAFASQVRYSEERSKRESGFARVYSALLSLLARGLPMSP